MLSPIYIIDRVIAEHHKIRESMRLTGESLNDVEASLLLTRSFSGWSQSSESELAAKKENMIQAISALAEGLNTHFGYEEKYLPPLFGEYLMKALVLEHNKARRQIEVVKNIVHETDMSTIDREALFNRKTLIQDNINRLLQTVEDHAGHEEIILLMIKAGIETPEKDTGK